MNLRSVRHSLVLLSAAFLLIAPIASPVSAKNDQQTLEGELQIAHADDFGNHKSKDSYTLKTRDGQKVKLNFRGAEPRLNYRTKVRVKGQKTDGTMTVAAGNDSLQVTSATAAPSAVGQKKVAAVLMNFQNNTSQPFTTDQVRKTIFTDPRSVKNYYKEQSLGKLDIAGKQRTDGDVLGWYTIAASSNSCDYDNWATMARNAAQAAGNDLSGYDYYFYIFPSAPACMWSGLSYIGGDTSWINGAADLATIGHEFGHDLGVHHASSLTCYNTAGQPVAISNNCTHNEYGDPFDIMAYGPANHTNNWHKAQFGWLSAASRQTVTSAGTYTLSAQETAGSGIKIIRVPRTKDAQGNVLDYYYLEYRRPYGAFDNFASTDPVVNGLSIRIAPDYQFLAQSELLDMTPETYSWLDSALGRYRTFSDSAKNVYITTDQVTSSAATVNISFTPSPSNATTAPLYRYFNSNKSDTLYLTARNDGLLWFGWSYKKCDSLVYTQPKTGMVRIWQYGNSDHGDHILSVDRNDSAFNYLGYKLDTNFVAYGYPAKSPVAGTIPLYRYYQTHDNNHLYTTTRNDALAYFGYKFERIEANVLPPSSLCQ